MTDFWTCDDCGESVNCHDDNHRCPGPPLRLSEVEDVVDRLIDARLRAIAARLRLPPDGPLMPDAEVYVRTVVAQAIEEGVEER